jgi:6-pyruvoyltetrahydropterin/6-carboxytetrahydropterin synthase
MYRISKCFEFSASHALSGLAPGHPCGRMHGHNYIVELILEGGVTLPVGFVRDYRDLDDFKAWLTATLDHRSLNDTMPPTLNPTAENLAAWLYYSWTALLPELAEVRVSETPKTWASFRP